MLVGMVRPARNLFAQRCIRDMAPHQLLALAEAALFRRQFKSVRADIALAGCVRALLQADDVHALVQHQTRLYLVNVRNLSQDLFYQQVGACVCVCAEACVGCSHLPGTQVMRPSAAAGAQPHGPTGSAVWCWGSAGEPCCPPETRWEWQTQQRGRWGLRWLFQRHLPACCAARVCCGAGAALLGAAPSAAGAPGPSAQRERPHGAGADAGGGRGHLAGAREDGGKGPSAPSWCTRGARWPWAPGRCAC